MIDLFVDANVIQRTTERCFAHFQESSFHFTQKLLATIAAKIVDFAADQCDLVIEVDLLAAIDLFEIISLDYLVLMNERNSVENHYYLKQQSLVKKLLSFPCQKFGSIGLEAAGTAICLFLLDHDNLYGWKGFVEDATLMYFMKTRIYNSATDHSLSFAAVMSNY